MHECLNLLKKVTSEKEVFVFPIENSGSNRKYFRITAGNQSYIGVEGTSDEENKSFITLANHFLKKGLPVPQIIAASDDCKYYLQEDLGNKSLFEMIKNGRETGIFSEKEKELLKKTIKKLSDFQFKGAEGLDFSNCYPQPEFDKRTILWDLNYFKYCFLKVSGIEFREDLLEDDFEKLSAILLQFQDETFMYRDFQSRNVIIRSGDPYFIDFQGGRKGPVFYDVASFLWQAKANFPEQLRTELLEIYLDSLEQYQPDLDRDFFKQQLRYFVLFRTLQVLGAYGFRGYIEKKAHFIESISYAITNLKAFLKCLLPECPYLYEVLGKLVSLERFQPQEQGKILQLTIFSFSYKKGIPDDYSGNGGGYVFDCRMVHNPGKYEEYKRLTGLDQPVIDFLEKYGEIIPFMKNVMELADNHVKRYLERGFTHLMFSFGCTGGQHRSVYAAKHLAMYLAEKYPVKISLEHREQGIREIIDHTIL